MLFAALLLTAAVCPATPTVIDCSPVDEAADPIVMHDWYINADRSIWVAVPADGWPSGGTLFQGDRAIKGQKTYWVRPRGEDLIITGRRLDSSAPPLEAQVPCCYPTGFQIVALHFPTEGCWEVSAKAGTSELTFVTRVAR